LGSHAAAGLRRAEGGVGFEAASVDGVDGNLGAGKEVGGVAVLVFRAGDDGEGVGKGGVGENVERE